MPHDPVLARAFQDVQGLVRAQTNGYPWTADRSQSGQSNYAVWGTRTRFDISTLFVRSVEDALPNARVLTTPVVE